MKNRINWFDNRETYNSMNHNRGEDIFVHYSTIGSKDYKIFLKKHEISFNLIDTNERYQSRNKKITADYPELK